MKKKFLKSLTRETKPKNFRAWKSGKVWLFGLSLIAAAAFFSRGSAATPTSSTISMGSDQVYSHFTFPDGTYADEHDFNLQVAGQNAFCIQPFVTANNGDVVTQNTANAAWAALPTNVKKDIEDVSYLADQTPSDVNMYWAAQYLIWQEVTTSNLSGNASGNPTITFTSSTNSAINQATISADETKLQAEAANLQKLPSWSGSTVTLKPGQPLTVTDTNGVVANYFPPNSSIAPTIPNGVTLTGPNGNDITLNTTNAAAQSVLKIQENVPATPIVWEANGGSSQTTITVGDPNQQTATLNLNVAPQAGSVKIIKNDNLTGQPIAGAVFEFLDAKGNVITTDASGAALPNNGQFTTGTDGTVTVNNLPSDGSIVTVREVSVPKPYTLSNNLTTVINPDGTAHAPSTDLPVSVVAGTTAANPTGVTFSDRTQVQAIKIKKTATLNGKAVGSFPNGNYGLQDAVFTIKDVTKGTTIGNLYSDGNGVADLSSLAKTGDTHQSAAQYQAMLNQMNVNGDTYSIQETSAPLGLAADWNGGKPQTFTLNASGDDTQLINPEVEDTTNNNTDTPITVSATLTKVDSDTNSNKSQGAGLLPGTIETLFYNADVMDASGNVIHHKGDPVKWTDGFSENPIAITSGAKADNTYVTLSVANGVNTVGVKNLPLTADSAQTGYYFAETDAKGKLTPGFGYTDNTNPFPIQSGEGADGTGSTSQVTVINGLDTQVTQADHVLTVGLEFTKVLNDNSSLTGENGAVFTVIPNDSATQGILNGVNSQTNSATSGDGTGADGYTVAGLTKFKFAIGNYKIHQTVVPAGTQPIQDILVNLTPNANASSSAPDTYTLTVKWADGTQIYTKSFNAADFTNANANLINVNLGSVTDNKLVSPTITTHATDKSDGDQTLAVGKVIGQDDSVIKNLPAGDYTEVTKWVDSSGAVIADNGKPVTATKDFTSTGSGEDDVTTTVQFNDSQLQGKNITAEEFVYPKGNTTGTPVVSETNYQNNAKQTLTVGTAKGQTQVQSTEVTSGKISIPDTYTGTGFVPGQSVDVKVDSIYDHSTNLEIPASGTATFTADSQGNVTGTINVTVDTTNLQGHELTFFESTYIANELVFQLHDKNAKPETVTVTNTPPTPPSVPTPPSPSIDIEKVNGKDVPAAGKGNNTDADNNAGPNDHDTASTADDVANGATTDITFAVTNNGTEPLTHVKVVDALATDDQSGKNVGTITWTYNGTALTPNSDGEFLLNGQLLVLPVGDKVVGHATLPTLDAGKTHGDKATVSAVGAITGKTVGDSDKWYGETPTSPVTPSVDIEKVNGKDVPPAGKGNNTDTDNNAGPNDHDTASTADNVNNGATTDITFAVTNNGTEPLTHVKVVDALATDDQSGKNVGTITWTYNDSALTLNSDGEFLLNNQILELPVGGKVVGHATLPALEADKVHGDKATVSAIGAITGKTVGDSDKWYGKVKTALVNIFLPNTGDNSSSMLAIVGTGILTLTATLALRKKKHS